MNYLDILNMQNEYFKSGETMSYKFRINNLKKLKSVIIEYTDKICSSLHIDLNKSSTESIMCEIGMVITEINYHIKHLKKWMKKQNCKTPLILKPGTSYILPTPIGTNLVISPWNYPILLTLNPVIGIISSGSVGIIKPSEYSRDAARVIKEMIVHNFDKKYLCVINGDSETTKALVKLPFDHIFFTGSTTVAKDIISNSCKNLPKYTLELGGKSPCIIDNSAYIHDTCSRIVFNKFLNAGQTCVAPDYILCHKAVYEYVVKGLIHYINEYFTSSPLTNKSYPKIINQKHFDRLQSLLNTNDEILYGGKCNPETLQIEPTIVNITSIESDLMKEEIFGPILPIYIIDDEDSILPIINQFKNPLATYIFSNNHYFIERILSNYKTGGVCINDCISHITNNHLPFGGVGSSGVGAYHGKYTFDTFTHMMPIYKKHYRFEIRLKYPPHSQKKENIIKKFLIK